MNRGLAHRAAFEDRRDIRFFLSLVARKVREGEIEVHAYAILTTHFHLLVRSPRGELSRAMMWIENQYVRRFNRRRDRDGSLFKGRFTSRLVDSLTYWHVLIRYIDDNPVQAGFVRSAAAYPHCSARQYARTQGPVWLSRGVIEEHVRTIRSEATFDPKSYASIFGDHVSDEERWLVERRTHDRTLDRCGSDPFDDLIGGAPDRVRRWLQARTRLADGGQVGLPIAAPQALLKEIELRRALRPTWSIPTGHGRIVRGWETMAAGLLRSACSLSFHEIARRIELSDSSAARAVGWHARFIGVDAIYMSAAAEIVSAVLPATVLQPPMARRA